MIEDVNTILNDAVLTGDTIEELYKVLPALDILLMIGSDKSSTVDFYVKSQPERFADLAKYSDDGTSIIDDVVAEYGTVTTPGTFTKFFEENPITCASAEYFQKEFNTRIYPLGVAMHWDTSRKIPLPTDLVLPRARTTRIIHRTVQRLQRCLPDILKI